MRIHVRSVSVVILLGMVLLAGLAVLPAMAGSSMMFRMNPQHTGDYSSVSNGIIPNEQLKWAFTTGSYVHSSPAVYEGTVYVGSVNGNVYAIDATSGIQKWAFPIGTFNWRSSPAVYSNNNMVYIGDSEGKVHAIDATSHNQKWVFAIGNNMEFFSPAVDGNSVFIGGTDGKVYAIDANTGGLIWVFTAGSWASTAVAEGMVYIGSYDGKVYAIDELSGVQRWVSTTGDMNGLTSPTVADGVVYIGGFSSNLYAFDAATGDQKWSSTNPGTGDIVVDRSPAVAGEVVYMHSHYHLYAINTIDGSPKWEFPTDSTGPRVLSSPTVADGVVYVGCDDGKVYAIDAESGTTNWAFATGSNGVVSSPAVVDGVVYVGGNDGKVYAIGKTPPTFASIDPTSGAQGEFVPVSITGSNFASSTTVKFSKAGSPDMPLLVVPPVMPTNIGGGLFIPADAAAGDWDIVITIPYGGQVTAPGEFMVISSPPFFSSITPSSGAVGATVPVTITGNFFVSGATVKFQRYGSPDMPLVIDMVTTTTITGTLSIPPGAATGEWFILITNPDGKSSVTPFGAFTVTSTGIKVTAITPNSGVVGSTVSINNLAGTGFVAGAAVKLTKGAASIPATSINVASPTKIKCNFAIPSDAVLGTYSVVVTNPGGTTSAQLTDGFTVTNTPPTVTSISPNTDVTGKTVDVTLTGTGFMPGVTGTTVTLSGNGPITYLGSNVVVSSPTTITCTIDLTGAKTGNYDVVVTNHDGQSGTLKNGFKVTLTGISVTGIKPSSGAIGTTISITNLAGTGFQAGATVQLTRAGAASITATNVVVASKTRIKCDFAIPSDAVLGTYNVVVTNPGGTSAELTNGFTVTNPPPTVSSISPSTGVTGTTVTITSLTGTGFMTGATVTLSGNGPIAYSAMNVVVSSSTTITCTIALTGAKTGTYNVVVTNTDGQLGVLMNGFKVTKK